MFSESPRSTERFLASWPEFAPGGEVDELRTREFARLDAGGDVYLDYTGAGLAGASQIHRHLDLLLGRVLGNPHSQNPTSQLASELVDRARRHVLSFFNASPDDYLVVFTANASHALKLVGESYPFGPGKRFVLTFDNHNSVNGIREYARAAGAEIAYIPVLPPDLRVEAATVTAALEQGVRPGLFAFPAQSNFSGVQHDLSWIAEAQSRGWDVLLDAAAFVPTNRLDLSRWRPDFAVLSFYKMFGYPTGVGALIARRSALGTLRRPWFAGGTITVASVGADQHHLAAGAAAFEDGTPNFGSLPAIDFGLEFLEQVGVDVVHRRVKALTGWLIETLLSLRHSTGGPLVTLYGPPGDEARGGTVTLNFRDEEGRFIDHQMIEQRAGARRISIRSGCFCNPGAGELAMGISPGEMKSCFIRLSDRITYDDFRRCIDGKSTGAVRVSFGLASTFGDARAFVEFARTFLA
jgi:molybdenum cofactor sulfurtransferase